MTKRAADDSKRETGREDTDIRKDKPGTSLVRLPHLRYVRCRSQETGEIPWRIVCFTRSGGRDLCFVCSVFFLLVSLPVPHQKCSPGESCRESQTSKKHNTWVGFVVSHRFRFRLTEESPSGQDGIDGLDKMADGLRL
jgi:hypothetical protein